MSENTVLVSFNVKCSKQIVPWTFLPVDRTMTVAELCKSIFVGMDFKKRAR
jgi:cytochrome c oxidase assembly protein Cox11